MINEIRSVLNNFFGFSDFRFGQDEIINSVISGNDTLAVMPTGGGKSLCYQLPALVMNGTAIVISPLIALMKDQVDALEKRNYPATYINSSLSPYEIRDRMSRVAQGQIKLLYLAPERLESKQFHDLIKSITISFLAVDEAHCISEWGHDFRPSYLAIPTAFAGLTRFPIIGLTATATPEVQDDIIKVLGIPDAKKFIRGFDRPNLSYHCIETKDKISVLNSMLSLTKGGSSIIYCGSRKRVEQFHDEMLRKKIRVVKYHAGLTDSERKSNQDYFIKSENPIIIATNAFGMGIDKPNVRNVIHLDYTLTLEAYYQEAGRAGRDGDDSTCLLLHNSGDVNLQHFFIKSNHPEKKDIISVYNKIFDLAQISLGKTGVSAIFLSDVEIANLVYLPIATVSSILKLFEKEKIILRGSANGFGRIKITRNRDELFEIYGGLPAVHQESLEAMLRDLSRETFRHMIEFDIDHLLAKHNLDRAAFSNSLHYFQNIGIINYFPPVSASGISIISERADSRNIPIDFVAINRRRDFAYKKFDIVRKYSQTSDCKRNYILDYFGETDINGECGKCSSCLSQNQKSSNAERNANLEQSIINAISELKKSFGRKMISDFVRGKNTKRMRENGLNLARNFACGHDFSEDDVMNSINDLIKSGHLISESGQYPVLKLTSLGESAASNKRKFLTPSKSNKPDDGLYPKLKALRLRIAKANSMNVFQVITDKMMRKIADTKPVNSNELRDIEGLSTAFIDNFGELFVREINSESDINQETNVAQNEPSSPLKDYISKNLTIYEIAERSGLSITEVGKELQILIESGTSINTDGLIEKPLLREIAAFISEYPSALLRDVRTYFGSRAEMPALRVAAAIVRRKLRK